MKSFGVVEYFIFFVASILLVSTIQGQQIHVNINGSKPIRVVDNKSPSFAVGMGLFKYRWVKFLSDPKLLTLVKALGPAYIRMGGTKSDHAHFVPGHRQSPDYPDLQNCVGQKPNANDFEAHRIRAQSSEIADNILKRAGVFVNTTYTGAEFDDFMSFVKCAKWDLLFGLNLLDRQGGEWNPNNSQELLQYAKEQRYRVNWELGNEPNSYYHKTGVRLSASQVAKAFFKLNNILRGDTWWIKSKLVGPDTNDMVRSSSKTFFKKFLHYAGTVITGSTVHQYYINSKGSTIQNFTSPKILNDLLPMVRDVVKIAESHSPNVPVWFGETSSSYGGGAAGLSDTFVAGFMWLDKLGVCAANGISIVFRQTLLQGNYAMINDNFDPNPDYWLTLLYKRLVGTRVLNVTLTPVNGKRRNSANIRVRAYAHCTNTIRTNYNHGSVTIYYLNLSRRRKTITFNASQQQAPKTAMTYILTSSPTSLNSSYVYLNDERLQMVDDRTLPALRPLKIDLLSGEKIRLPQMSFGFIVLPDMNVTACMLGTD